MSSRRTTSNSHPCLIACWRSPPPRYGFTSRERQADSGLYYRARWFDPAVGRFLASDPWRFVDGPNLFAYVRNNPVNFVDPKGLGGGDCRTPCINGGGGGPGPLPPDSDCPLGDGACGIWDTRQLFCRDLYLFYVFRLPFVATLACAACVFDFADNILSGEFRNCLPASIRTTMVSRTAGCPALS